MAACQVGPRGGKGGWAEEFAQSTSRPDYRATTPRSRHLPRCEGPELAYGWALLGITLFADHQMWKGPTAVDDTLNELLLNKLAIG